MQENLRTFLVRGASGSAGIKAAGAGIAFGTHLLAARLLGVEPYGTYILAITWLQLLTLLAVFGMDTNLLRFVPTYRVQQDWPRLKGILRWSANLATLNGLAVAGVAALVVWGLSPRLGGETALALWCAFVVLPFAARLIICRSALQGLHRVVLADLSERIVVPLLFVLLLYLTYVAEVAPRNATVAVTCYAAAVGVALALAFRLLKGRLPREVESAAAQYEKKVWLRSSFPLLLLAGMGVLMSQLDILMLGAMVGVESAGIYAAASRVANLLAFGLVAVNAALAPLISRLHSEGRTADLQRVVTLSVRWVSLFALCAGVVIIAFGKVILSWFGAPFTAGSAVLVILVAGQLMNALCGSVGYLMSMTGQQAGAARVMGAVTVMNIILNAVLIPIYGMVGAAVATAAALMAWNVVLAVRVHRQLGIHSTILGRSA